MKKVLLITILSIFLSGCATTLIKTGAIADENRINMASLKVGMSKGQVSYVMGSPYKIENSKYNGVSYTTWFYITEAMILGQTQLVGKNLTPLIFQSNKLLGWGRNFYKFTFDISREKWKRELEKKQKYTDDKEEWPRNQHLMIPAMNEKSTTPEDELNQTILDIEKDDQGTDFIQTNEGENQDQLTPKMQTIEPTDQQMPIDTTKMPKNGKTPKSLNGKANNNQKPKASAVAPKAANKDEKTETINQKPDKSKIIKTKPKRKPKVEIPEKPFEAVEKAPSCPSKPSKNEKEPYVFWD